MTKSTAIRIGVHEAKTRLSELLRLVDSGQGVEIARGCEPVAKLAIVGDVRNVLFFPAASAWEIAIKYQLGKLALPEAPASYVPGRMPR